MSATGTSAGAGGPTRWRLLIEYDGRPFVGWQRQDNGPSVQGAIEAAIQRFCGETVTLFAAGRTDAGVHARGQVAHFDCAKPLEARAVRDAVNHHLRPQPVAILTAEAVDETFHARLSARQRGYLYRIVNRKAPLALDAGRAWHIAKPLDAEAMHAAAQLLVGHHDFTSFRASLCQAKSPLKTLDRLDVVRDGDEVRVTARARSFLHHQVRNMVGTLAQVGEGRWTADDVRTALEARDRSAAGPTAPADGLFFTDVVY
ncbi:tRNA pseudouridine(38-40) synthase TruA [Arenibaculum pallidiluteum]|uniref:tRNA pseudouridine(38-40) synthase TruA n=1 Tax=Arenibaculum pallidiluteum TaxID=2812559 RepID=UPI001A959FBE|nr:tRNA pseudouridine(38-40) synthase TruA [Arenibaculum pallidiluteum]